MLLHGLYEFFRRYLRLGQDGLDSLWRQVPGVSRNHHVKVRLTEVAEIDVASGLVMNVESLLQESL